MEVDILNYFDCAILLKKNTPYRSYQIYQEVYSSGMIKYAKSIYGANFEDALDKAYRHILENFDPEKGELTHYVTSTISKINFNNGKEFSYDEVTTLAMDSLAFKNNYGDPQDEVFTKISETLGGDTEICIRHLLKCYIEDFKFFKSKKLSDRVNEYGDLFDRFSVKTILTAVNYISEKYDADVEELYTLKKQMRFKHYDKDRYKDSFDDTVEYMCDFNGIIVYKKNNPKLNKVVYEINIQDILKRFTETYYKGMLNRNIGGIECYVTLSGKIVMDYKELLSELESEIIGSVLSRLMQVGVIRYEFGKSMLLTSSSPMSRTTVTLLVLDIPFTVELSMRVSKSARG